MSAVNKSSSPISLDSLKPSDDQWRGWREGRNALYWQAAMLTLQIEPNSNNRELLKEHFPDVYAEYQQRLKVMRKRRHSYRPIKPLDVSDKSPSFKNQIVSLPGVANLCIKLDWDKDRTFAHHVIVEDADESLNLSSQKSTEQREVEDLKAADRRTLVRYAALVELCSMAISDPNKFDELKKSMFKKEKVSDSALGRAVEEIVKRFAKDIGLRNLPTGFKERKNAREISKAKLAVEEHFARCKS